MKKTITARETAAITIPTTTAEENNENLMKKTQNPKLLIQTLPEAQQTQDIDSLF